MKSTLTDEERTKLTNEVLHEHTDKYGMKQAAAYFDYMLRNDNNYEPDGKSVNTKEDVMMLVAGMIYSGTAEFPYKVELVGGMVDTPVANISKIRITREKSNG